MVTAQIFTSLSHEILNNIVLSSEGFGTGDELTYIRTRAHRVSHAIMIVRGPRGFPEKDLT